jgi:hypothetical protein
MDKQQQFLNDLLFELDDIKFDIECDLGTQSVPYEKVKSLILTIEEYQENLV